MLTDQQFVGLANYQALLNDKVFWTVLGNTISFMMLTVAINVTLALLVATGLKHRFYGSDFLRVLYYAPGILSVSVLGIIGIRIWDPQLGHHQLLRHQHARRSAHQSGSAIPNLVIPVLSITTVWWTFGFPMLVFIAGLHGIPEALYDAAKIDGAGPSPVVSPYHDSPDHADDVVRRRDPVHRAYAGLRTALHHHGRRARQRVRVLWCSICTKRPGSTSALAMRRRFRSCWHSS